MTPRRGDHTWEYDRPIPVRYGLVLTSGSLALLDLTSPGASHTTELVVLVIANAVATLLRFVAYRAWVFHPRRQSA